MPGLSRLLAVWIAFTVGLFSSLQPGLADQGRPNILLILSDDHSVPHVGAYGDANCKRFQITPHLDEFASQGMRFDRAYTAAPQCAPSRTAIFSGCSPVRVNATRFAQPARNGTPLFTDLLRSSGYWVGLDGRHQHLEGRGRDIPVVNDALVKAGMKGTSFESRFDHFVQSYSTKKENLDTVADRIGAILDEVPEGKPWFLYFGFNQPHRRWGDDHQGIDPAQLTLPDDWPDLPQVRLDYARYLAEVRDLDRGFGLILKLLDDRKIMEDTLVIFMGDNGEALLRGKGTLFTRGTQVPLILRWPGKVESATASQKLISGVDLAPTILAAAGQDPATTMTGVSFLDELLGCPFDGREYLFAERGWHFGPLTRTDGFDLSRSVTSQRYHLIYNAIPERVFAPVDMAKNNIAWNAIQQAHDADQLSALHERLYFQNPRPIFELYDLESDPYQLNNLSGQRAVRGVELELRTELDRWMVLEGDFLPLPSHVHQTTRQR